MPNWCCANVEISATETEIKRLKKAIKAGNKDKATKGLLNAMVPQPKFEGDSDWYSWNVDNWGTKWEVSHVSITEETATSLTLTFDTAWGPATTAFETWAGGGEGDFTYTYKYYEPGMAFLGEATHDGTCSFDDQVSANDDPDRYREIARDEWGDEPWDEEEDEEDEEDLVEQAPYHPGYEDVTITDDAGMTDTTAELRAALEELKREFDALYVTEDPVYVYLKEDIERLTERVKAYKENQDE